MKIERKRLTELKPSPYNPRKDLQVGDAEYEKLRRSLQEFGYVEPIIWNARTGYVVGGHQRLKVLRQLGETEIDCVIVDLPEEQEKALNVVLNKIKNDWDMEKLEAVLSDLRDSERDVTLTGFDLEDIDTMFDDGPAKDDEDTDSYYGDERERTFDMYRLHECDATRVAGYYQFPMLKACHYVPDDLIGFNYVKNWRSKRDGIGVHFFLDDYQFERIWKTPYGNIERMRGFGCVLTPDFSLYMDMPMAMKIWNVYRSRLIGQMMQDAGLTVIPTLQWADEESFTYCFEGIEPNGVYAFSTVGVMKEKGARERCYAGIGEAVKRLTPEGLIMYGAAIKYDFGEISVKYVDARKFIHEV